MKLACYGWVDEDAGSLATANYLILRELLDRGIEIDLFGNPLHVPAPPSLIGRAGFTYVTMRPPRIDRYLPPNLARIVNWAFAAPLARSWRARFARAVRTRPGGYDCLLSLGAEPIGIVPGVPTVCWTQAAAHTELDAIRSLRRQIEATSGRWFYLVLSTWYLLDRDRRIQRRRLSELDAVIALSEFTVQAFRDVGVATRDVYALPYPIDLQHFSPASCSPTEKGGPIVLSLGRLDPRKRLDLLLDSFRLLLEVHPDARLVVVGRPGYAPNQLSLLDDFDHRDSVQYFPSIARERVPELIRSATLLLQPSMNENFGSSAAEALACGVPVVVGPTNGTKDYIDETSMVFDCYEPGDVAAAMTTVVNRVASSPVDVRTSARAAAERYFDLRRVVDQLVEIIDRAARPRP